MMFHLRYETGTRRRKANKKAIWKGPLKTSLKAFCKSIRNLKYRTTRNKAIQSIRSSYLQMIHLIKLQMK